MQRLLIGFVLADFAALNVYAASQYGYLGVWQLATANAATLTILADLTIALSLVTIWMVRDARQRGVALAPYLVLTAVLGSIGPLLYLFRRAEAPQQATTATPVHARA